jgi:hypothetical protein
MEPDDWGKVDIFIDDGIVTNQIYIQIETEQYHHYCWLYMPYAAQQILVNRLRERIVYHWENWQRKANYLNASLF